MSSSPIQTVKNAISTRIIKKQLRWRLAAMLWIFSECMALGFLGAVGALRWSLFDLTCILTGPFAALTAIPRFQYDSLWGNIGFVLVFLLLAASPFLHPSYPKRWTLILSGMAWLLWPWIGFMFTINHM
jgi:hypothetical protein